MIRAWGLFLLLCLFSPLVLAQSPIGDTIVSQSLRAMLSDEGEFDQIIWSDGTGPTTTHPGGGGGGGDFADGGEAGGANRTLGNTDNFELGLLTNNVEAITILGNGRVGINATAPGAQLHVDAGTSNTVSIFETTGGSGMFMDLTNGVRNWAFGMNSSENFIIRDQTGGNIDVVQIGAGAPVNSMRILSTGFVGFGKSPMVPLDLESTNASLFSMKRATTGGTFFSIANNALTWRMGLDAAETFYVEVGGSGNRPIQINSGSTGDVLYIDGSNNVGIGTTTPSALLHVEGPTEAVSIHIGEPITSVVDTTGMHIGPGSDTNSYIDAKLKTGGKFVFRYGEGTESGTTNTWMSVDGGMVGVGKATPTYQLDVENGSDANLLRLTDTGIVSLNVTSGITPSRIMIDANASNDLVFQSAGGDVGIGLIDPDTELHLDGGVNTGIKIDGSGGGCLMIRDTDDAGWTECFTLNGAMSCTIDADGVCDGS